MQNPKLITQAAITALAPSETTVVRLVLPRIQTRGPVKIMGKINNYQAVFNNTVKRHVLDVPVTIWMTRAPAKTAEYLKNTSIADDIAFGQQKTPQRLTVLVYLT